jgi:hypothetical protein
MKHIDNILPYILASMHPIMHLTMLTGGAILRGVDEDKFFNVPNAAKCAAKAGSKAQLFIGAGKEESMNMIMLGHFIAIVCHYLSGILTKRGNKVAAGWSMLVKIFTVIFVHFLLQSSIIFDECRDGIVDESQVMAWLSYEVMAFYLNIVAMSVFLLLSSAKKFYSIRDRLGLGTDQRKKNDFLNYC